MEEIRNPFTRGGCVPLAWAHVSETPTAAFAGQLAHRATERRTIFEVPMFNFRNGSGFTRGSCAAQWAELAGVRIVEELGYREVQELSDLYRERRGYRARAYERASPCGMTTAQLLDLVRPGERWVVAGNGHAFAIRDGRVFNGFGLRRRVQRAWRVEPIIEEVQK